MKSLNTKLALSVMAIAMLATPALAARAHQRPLQQPNYSANETQPSGEVFTYPNGAARTGTAESVQSGAEFNLQSHPAY